MAKTFEFEQTSIPSQYSINLYDNFGMMWVDSRTSDLYRILLDSIAETLKFNQAKDVSRIGMSMLDDKGNFKFGAILNYKKPEEGSDEDSGNWYLEFTFYKEDMEDIDISVDNHSDIFIKCASQSAYQIIRGRFRSTDVMYNVFNTAIDTLTEFLDTNATETEEVEVVLPSIFTASVAIENGVKVMSIVPGEVVKQVIKNDSAI